MEMAVKSLGVVLLGLLLAAWVAPALARCLANGQTYDAGTVIGNYKCQSDGSWTPRN